VIAVLTIASWNVNSLRARLPLVLRYLDERAPDVLCLQETRVGDAELPRAPFAERGYHVTATGSGGYAGVATVARAPLADVATGLERFAEPKQPGRRLLGRLGELWIDNVYVPTRMAIGKAAFLDALRDDHDARFGVDARVVLAGDFNICFDARDLAAPGMIAEPELLTRRPEDLAWRRLLASAGLHDCFRRRHEDGGDYTWFAAGWAFARNHGMRLDYLFASAPLAATLTAVEHDRDVRSWKRPSDHVPVRATFAGWTATGEPA
jgi:exodeoxyribonuclease-3